MGPQRTIEQVPQVVLIWPQAWAQVSSSVFLRINYTRNPLGILLKFTSGSEGLGRVWESYIYWAPKWHSSNWSSAPPANKAKQQDRMGLGPRLWSIIPAQDCPVDWKKEREREGKKESEVTQLCLTLCDPVDCSLLVSSVHGIFQARVLEWIAISFFRGSSQPRNRTHVSHTVGRRFTIWATREVLWTWEGNFYLFKTIVLLGCRQT